MKALLVYPRFPNTYWGFQYGLPLTGTVASLPPLGLVTLAAQLPSHWQLRLVDLNVRGLQDADLDWADVVLLSGMQIQKSSMLEVLERARTRGCRAVVGGPAGSSCPQDFAEADWVFVGEVEGRADELVVVTGGEPLLQEGTRSLLSALVRAGHRVVVETNGTVDMDGLPPQVVRVVDVKCPGSGESDKTRWALLERLRSTDEVKFVCSDRADFDYAVDVVDRYELEESCTVLLSPVSGRLEPTDLADWILERGGGLRLQLQLHRILWPDRHRGV